METHVRQKRSRRTRTGAAALVLALAAVAGCSSDSGGDDDTVKVGVLASLSGTYKAVGTDLRDGFQLYLDTHGGKLGGKKAELVAADEGDGPPTAVPAATKLIKKDKVDALTGIVSGGTFNAVLPLVNSSKIPLIGSNARPEVKDVSRVWDTSFFSDEPGRAIAGHVKKEVDGPVYAIGPDYQGGYDELRGFTDAFKEEGGKLANPGGKTKWTPFPKTTNFTPYFSEIARSGAKAVYCFYAGKAAVDFVKQYAKSDIADLPLYSAGFLTEGSLLNAQGDSAKGIYSVLNYAQDLDGDANRKFVADWTAKHETPPTTYAMASYDAAAVLDQAVADAAKDGGEVTPEAINKAIDGLGQIDSPRGAWEFNKKTHSPVQKWYLRQVRPDGKQLANVMVQDLATLGG
ncbi:MULTISPECIES: ABC transporter substrate-binding protein [Streptomyces]|uniref:Extracellular ligand-binding receptor n=1 Tax=Streptomyces albus (strain ATCC 21838 / DSM 41398 / FERM P-419 / JCM 4703 / NBRC 107858) TaxID=1081613 RepID=A0A0B5EPY7_STRA4|nr:ABC transporter substrate-binding protein [Streptomyces sp. SCSIO ZS0520]AJE83699.1 Extracellular ligand-binding receptor [Streptomyces albus]AOU78006.1 Extracellular ligand-binding receptor [Streptomyces albus]AYN33760.1 amino acid ABC transporter substrate-binding protein [Streptomyces albus]